MLQLLDADVFEELHSFLEAFGVDFLVSIFLFLVSVYIFLDRFLLRFAASLCLLPEVSVELHFAHVSQVHLRLSLLGHVLLLGLDRV